MPAPADMSADPAVGSAAAFDERAVEYDHFFTDRQLGRWLRQAVHRCLAVYLPGQRILELGCGWGGMLQKVYSVTGDKQNLVGYSLSKEQNQPIQERYGFRVEYRDVITTDYEKAGFDKI